MALLTSVIFRGTRSAQPAATAVATGTLYYVTDESITEYSTGSAWVTFADGGSSVSSTDFAWFMGS